MNEIFVKPKGHAIAETLEALLGDPRQPENPISFAYSQRIDETEAFPVEGIEWLFKAGLAAHWVPEAQGGAFRSLAELSDVMRVLSRRDLTTAHALSTIFWSFLVWIGGNGEQKRWLAQYMLERHGAMCVAYTEKEHGADFVANDTVAKRVEGGYELTGQKWPIHRATVSGVAFVLAATDAAAGARGLSLFMVDKSRLDPARFSYLPKILTHGLRGSDTSGIVFDRCRISGETLIGREGSGLEVALKGFQITRALCAPFSLGAGDTALRTTMSFAVRRKLYNEALIDLPHAAATLTDAYLDLLICDCLTIAGLRAFHVTPEQSGLWASVVKYYVPTTIETMIQNISVILGARYYMREEHEWGTFQRVLRDAAIVSVFDGSTTVNLHALILQFRHLARRPMAPGDQESRLRQIYNFDLPVPTLNPQKLGLVSLYASDALEGVEPALTRLEATLERYGLNEAEADWTRALARRLAQEIAAHKARFADSDFEHGHRQSAALFKAAKRFCALHAAASCLHSWVFGRGGGTGVVVNGKWLAPALARIFETGLNIPQDDQMMDMARMDLMEDLQRNHKSNRMFSLKASKLAAG